MNIVRETVLFAGRELTIETGRLAKQASGSVFVEYGDSRVLVTATASNSAREGFMDFVPLTVDYVEKTYAAGKIPGGFFKREGRQSNFEILTSRLIDRPTRPLLSKSFPYEQQVIATVMSADAENETDIMAMCGASAALHVSDIPFDGPYAGVRVGYVDGEYIANPTIEQREQSLIDITMASTKDAIVMVEGEGAEVSEEIMLGALMFGQKAVQPVLELQEKMREQAGKEKRPLIEVTLEEAEQQKIKELCEARLVEAMQIKEKMARQTAMKEAREAVMEGMGEEYADQRGLVLSYVEDLGASIMRKATINTEKRIDGRATTEIRPIWGDTGLLPRAHGSAVFTRGETQAIVAATLGTRQDAQLIDALLEKSDKYFLLHYNFPPYSVGEARFLRGPGRREIGHGNLAERSLKYILPDHSEDFPYVVRLVSEITESNGSSSMASVCGGTLALMDAGVPIKKPLAGIAMGLIKEDDGVAILSDILGDEDHLGDMDFKVTGTRDGVTALQMDIKIKGISEEIMTQALEQARLGRLHILGKMEEVLPVPREELSKYAPRIIKITIPTDRIRDVIGKGGETIRGIIDQTGVTIDIEDSGDVFIGSADQAAADEAIAIINRLTATAEAGKVYKGLVTRIERFGAFVEILPGIEGLLHISEIDHRRIAQVEDVLHEGDEIEVKCLEVDERSGKMRLSRRALIEKPEHDDSDRGSERRGPDRDRDRGRDRDRNRRPRDRGPRK